MSMKELQKLPSLILGYLTESTIYKAQKITFSLNSDEALPRIMSGLKTVLGIIWKNQKVKKKNQWIKNEVQRNNILKIWMTRSVCV